LAKGYIWNWPRIVPSDRFTLLDELCFLPELLLVALEDEVFPSSSFSFALDEDLEFDDNDELELPFALEVRPDSVSVAELVPDFAFELETCLELLEESSGTLEEISISSGLSPKSTAMAEESSSPQAEKNMAREKNAKERKDPKRLTINYSIVFNNTIISQIALLRNAFLCGSAMLLLNLGT